MIVGISEEDGHNLWPLEEIDRKKGKFPCCIVWTPLPIISWLVPYIGHVGICREDGVVLDFSGSNLVAEDGFPYGPVARYLQLDREKCCFPHNLATHSCKQPYKHAENGVAISWDDALRSTSRQFENKFYNIFTCSSYSFVATCLDRLCYSNSLNWNMVNVAALVLWRGRWVGPSAIARSLLPFAATLCGGAAVAGWSYVIGLVLFSSLLLA
ncbi:protein REVERSION-TO-ETHYLENE SENSITIVITY1-like isoform X2 [Wolffia australiana]